ncbi:MAG: hypothetical protein K0S74_450 [Chlamydiales bacterium]|jgi:hypothetical protein|nr:hypothetical protein [Chlamydiales bacterium]
MLPTELLSPLSPFDPNKKAPGAPLRNNPPKTLSLQKLDKIKRHIIFPQVPYANDSLSNVNQLTNQGTDLQQIFDNYSNTNHSID